MAEGRFREERDSMGTMKVPEDALWGATTQRAVGNFPVSGRPIPREMIAAFGHLKAACAKVNRADPAAIAKALVPALEKLHTKLDGQARDWDAVVKIGSTHLMDATPIRMGQVFSGYASQADHAVARARRAVDALGELAIGGT